MKKKASSLTPSQYAQSAALFAAFSGLVLLFVAAEIILALRPHPYHWLVAILGGGSIATIVYFVAYWQRTHKL